LSVTAASYSVTVEEKPSRPQGRVNCGCAEAEETYTQLSNYCDELAAENEELRDELTAALSTIAVLEDPVLRAALTDPTSGDYGPVPRPS
jgi:hypothetical protein